MVPAHCDPPERVSTGWRQFGLMRVVICQNAFYLIKWRAGKNFDDRGRRKTVSAYRRLTAEFFRVNLHIGAMGPEFGFAHCCILPAFSIIALQRGHRIMNYF